MSSPRGGYQSEINSDDPEMLRKRLFVGSLPSNKMVRSDLDEMFGKFGKIRATLLKQGYGFVQFDVYEDAVRAVKEMNGTMFKGNDIDVKFAAEGRRKTADRDRARDNRPRDNNRDRDRYRDRSPLRNSGYQPRDGGFSRDSGYPPRDGGYPPRGDGYQGGPMPGGPTPGGEAGLQDRSGYGANAPVVTPVTGVQRPAYECEIVLMAPRSRGYAENIERRIKGNGLLTSLNLLQDPTMLPRVIEDVARRSVPFAVIINAENEQHSSLTVNILHGTPQEHRNMPADDAMTLISKHFEIYLQDLREKMSATTAMSQTSAPEFIPPDRETHYLLNLLADNRILTVAELDKVISYLEQRRARIQGRKAASERKAPITDQDLQDKILKILNSAGGSSSSTSQFVSATAQSSSNSGADPDIQKALDKLMNKPAASEPTEASATINLLQQYGQMFQ